MEMIIREIQAIQHDMKVMLSHADNYKDDADRGINVSYTQQQEGATKQQQIDGLVYYLINAKHDIDRLRDDMKEVLANLEKLVDTVEYETLAEEIRL
jgi:uncharacterized coiled-coil DUF342 family protein